MSTKRIPTCPDCGTADFSHCDCAWAIWMLSDPIMKPSIVTPELNTRNEQITLLEAYSKFLETQGYLDTDWRAEAPYAIDEFLKTQKP